jgi:hypothetical protein
MQNPLELTLARVNLELQQSYTHTRELVRKRDFIERELAATTILLSTEVEQDYEEYFNRSGHVFNKTFLQA